MIPQDEVAGQLVLHAPLAVAALTDSCATESRRARHGLVLKALGWRRFSARRGAHDARALGTERVHAFFAPYRSSDPQSAIDAQAVAGSSAWRCGRSRSPADRRLLRRPQTEQTTPPQHKMARERMTILFDQAKKAGALVLGTSGAGRDLLSFSTVFGDACELDQPDR
ncbi:MAG: hypothetical protein R2862_09125 [Thermoanaerobaculia bacterium]